MSLSNLTESQLKALVDQLQYEAKREGCRLYKPYQKQRDFHAAGKTHREVIFAAGNQCISPWTYLQTPGSTVRCADSLFAQEMRVLAWAGGEERTADTQGWFLRGIAPAFRVLLDTGLWFDCSATHLALTAEGYLPIAQLVLRAGGLRYWRTHEDLTASCATGDYLGGPQPHPAQDSDRESPRTSPGAPGYNLSWQIEDALGRIPERIRSCLESGLPTTAAGDRPHFGALFAQFSIPGDEPHVLRMLHGIQAQRRLLLESACALRSSDELAHHQVNLLALSTRGPGRSFLERLEPLRAQGPGASPSPSRSDLQDAMHEAVLGVEESAIYIPWEPLKLIGGSIIAMVPIGYQPLIDTQVPDFHNYKAGGVYHHNCGKSYSAAAELAIHLTGEYPDWWEGRVWDRPVHAWAAGVTGESTRDTLQRLLLGRPGELGTGTIPADCLISQTSGRGVADSVDTVLVRYKTGGTSTLSFKSYALGREKWQGATLDLVAFDEEPPMDVFLEGLTRTNATGGRIWLTFTPLMGMSEVVMRFFESESPDRKLVSATIDDAEHYSDEQRARIIASYPAHERDARAKGIPVLGSGRVFPISDDLVTCEPFKIPAIWPRICSLDFGYDHPAAATWLAHDRDTDTIYLYDSFKVRETSVALQAPLIAAKGRWIPTAWPHDGLQHDKGSGEELANQYRNLGVNMLPQRATFQDGGNGLEAGISEMLNRMQTGRWKVFTTQQDWMAEFRIYHRKNGLVNKIRDDLLSASRYGMMMIRYASTEPRSNLGKVVPVNFGVRRGGY